MMSSALICRDWRPLGPNTPADYPGLNLELATGQCLAICGHRDSPRQDYLRGLAGLVATQSERFEIASLDLRRPDEKQLQTLRQRSGFVSRALPLLCNLDVISNVLLPLRYHRPVEADHALPRATDLLNELGFRDDRHSLPVTLSARDSWLAQLARELILPPRLLLLDEPFDLEDPAQWPRDYELYRRLPRRYDTALVVLSSHLPFMRHCADRILFLDEEGPELMSREAFFQHQGDACADYRDTLLGASQGRP